MTPPIDTRHIQHIQLPLPLEYPYGPGHEYHAFIEGGLLELFPAYVMLIVYGEGELKIKVSRHQVKSVRTYPH